MITEEIYEIDIPIIIDRDLAKHVYNSFSRGYHALSIWNPLIGETLKSKLEPTNKEDTDAVAIM